MVVVRMIDNQNGRRNLTDGWKFQLSQAKKEILLGAGKESMSEGGKGLSTIDKPSHNTRDTIANDLGWKFQLSQAKKEILLGVGKNAQARKPIDSVLSTIDKTEHNTQKTIANDLGWSTGKVAMAD